MTLLDKLKVAIDIDSTLCNDIIYYEDENDNLEEEVGEYELVHSENGYEGGGSDVVRIFHLKEHDVYFQLNGYYSSYGGTSDGEWGGQVFPKQVMVTQYFSEQ